MKVEFTTPDGLEVKADVKLGPFGKPQPGVLIRRAVEEAGRLFRAELREAMKFEKLPGTEEKKAAFAKTDRGKLRAKEEKARAKAKEKAEREAAEAEEQAETETADEAAAETPTVPTPF